MGIDIGGGMIVGAMGHKIGMPDDYEGEFYEWVEENDLDQMSLYYDADSDDCIFGFTIPDVLVSEMDAEWLQKVKELSVDFEELTGEPAKLFGSQNVW
jgi:hypothetical protein